MNNDQDNIDSGEQEDEFLTFFETEAEGYNNGEHPLMGNFRRTFNFAPVPYGHRNRQVFVERVHQEMADVQYVFSDEVRLDITLYLDELTLFETPERADLDNFAKIICDSLKGVNGILIDDTQIHHLSISWIDTPTNPRFDIEFVSSPDNFFSKPLALYEMPDGLFYPMPLSTKIWHEPGDEAKASENMALFLVLIYEQIRELRGSRHLARQLGANPLEAMRFITPFRPRILGFHKSRIVDSGFPFYDMQQWKADTGFDNALNLAQEKGMIAKWPFRELASLLYSKHKQQ